MLLLLFSHLVVSDSLWPYGLQHARLPCPSLSLGAFSNSCPLSCWCPPTLSSVIPFSSCLQSLPASGSFPLVSSSHQIAKVLEFQPQYISPSNEYSGLISSRIGWFDLLAVQGTLKSSPAPHFKSINSVLSFLYGSTLKMHTLTFIQKPWLWLHGMLFHITSSSSALLHSLKKSHPMSIPLFSPSLFHQ